ncbi:MAG: hypothetical protein NXI24_18300 [bacterium]|nr:hypothetical protein [bacterium]
MVPWRVRLSLTFKKMQLRPDSGFADYNLVEQSQIIRDYTHARLTLRDCRAYERLIFGDDSKNSVR